jgi:hypothetical protein
MFLRDISNSKHQLCYSNQSGEKSSCDIFALRVKISQLQRILLSFQLLKRFVIFAEFIVMILLRKRNSEKEYPEVIS